MTSSKIPDWKNAVGPGWRPILDRLHAALDFLWPEYEVVQLKEKFGGLRVYLNDSSAPAEELILRAEELCAKTCEKCGSPGKIQIVRGWYRAACEDCKREAEE